MAHITDYDVWHESEEPVTVEKVIRILQGNTALAQKSISYLVGAYGRVGGRICRSSHPARRFHY
ncbi:MAG: hypothetical protein M5U34_34905 [Chloroflexi bacterium]|nr:hypothetical protein [Chloroflexota bacterium]